MSNVIEFPSSRSIPSQENEKSNRGDKGEKMLTVVEKLCDARGLASWQKEEVIEEFLPIYDAAFEQFTTNMSISANIGLTDEQLEVVSASHRDATDEIYEIFSSRLVKLCKELLVAKINKYSQ